MVGADPGVSLAGETVHPQQRGDGTAAELIALVRSSSGTQLGVVRAKLCRDRPAEQRQDDADQYEERPHPQRRCGAGLASVLSACTSRRTSTTSLRISATSVLTAVVSAMMS